MEKKRKLVIALVLVAVIGVVGGAFAFFQTSNEFKNVFSTSAYKTSVTEKFESPSNWTPGTETAKTVIAKNEGDVDVAVRVSYTESWLAGDGKTELALKQNSTDENNVAIINFDNTSDWTKSHCGSDTETNYWIYKSDLKNGQSTSSFIKSVTFNPDTVIDDETSMKCSDDTSVEGQITKTCQSTGKGYNGATYTLNIKVETVQADKKTEAWGTCTAA